MEKPFKLNKQLLGELGEYIYKRYAEEKGYNTTRVNMGEIDLYLDKESKNYQIDVKTTYNDTNGYKGKRVRDEIIYEQVVVSNKNLLINFDLNSPFKEIKKIEIKNSHKVIIDWRESRKNKGSKKINKFQKTRNEIKSELIEFLKKYKFNYRYIFRGSVSLTRWSSQPDSLPGSRNIINKYDYTIFVQMEYSEKEIERISKIFLFKHSEIGKSIKLVDSSIRQKKKGIMKVIDKYFFEKTFPNLVFQNINNLKYYIKENH